MDNSLLPASISAEHIKVFEQIVRERRSELPFSKLLIYIIDTVDSVALPYLAQQFNVLGNRGWRWAETDQQKRDLLKRALKMQRKEGTEFSVKESLKVLGINNAVIQHPIPGNTYNGQWSHNGTITYGGAYHWAVFRVLLDLDEIAGLPDLEIQDVVDLVIEWKNVRSKLLSVQYAANQVDSIAVTDNLILQINGTGLVLTFTLSEPGTVEFRLRVVDVSDVDIDWGDGDSETISVPATGLYEPLTHEYTSAGTYVVTVAPDDPALVAGLLSSDPTLTSITGIDELSDATRFFFFGTSIVFITGFPDSLTDLQIQDGVMTTESVDDLLVYLAGSGVSGASIFLNGNTPPAPPSATGLAAITTLEANGCSVTTD